MGRILNDKCILIIGAGGLLGSHLVSEILAVGARVIAADINVEQVNKRLSALGVDVKDKNLICTSLDVTDEDSLNLLFDEHEKIDGAVNATYPRNKAYGAHFFDVKIDDFNDNVSLHLGSSFLFMQKCASYFKKKKREFSLINISSVYGVVAPKFEIYDNTKMTMPVEYAAIKSAILHLSKYVVAYVADSRFRINSISPGGIFDHQPTSFLDAYKRQTLGKGMLDVTDVIGSVIYLLSDYARYVNGQNIIVDDGFVL